ncbi:hypothetical protein GDO81_027390 [Engystomops pustulosus]|uniref:Snake toxin/toxin-like domain-containing protein n=2 Tax=Engystomops pustulosus TaxID=76066 RepID=A0AAV6YQA4_ENGPU|nr:hypothetical protein GDO81_027390 [Engystomops pustulosus]
MCYYCPDETLSSECTDTKNCTAADSLCKTTVLSSNVGFPFDGKEVVIRGCSNSKCSPSSNDELGNSQIVFCCNVELCNNRGINATATNNNSSNTAAGTRAAIRMLLLGVSLPLIVTRP